MLPWVENLLPRQRDSSKSTDYFFPWFTATTSTPTYDFETLLKGFKSSLNSLCNNWSDHQVLDMNLDFDNPKCVWRQALLDLIRDSHKQHINNLKMWLWFFLLYLRQNIKSYTSDGLGLIFKILQKKTFCTRFDRSSLAEIEQ